MGFIFPNKTRIKKTLVCVLLFIFCCWKTTADDSVLDQSIDILKSKGSVYDLLNKISESSGMLFIYDGKTIENNRRAKLEGGKTTIKQAILDVIHDPQIEMKVIGRHILLQKPSASPAKMLHHPLDSIKPPSSYLTIEGKIRDNKTFELLAFVSVRVEENGVGTVANQNGHFLLKIPDSLATKEIIFSHIGYETQKIPSELLIGNYTDIYMNVEVIPIQEVIVSLVNPLKVIKNMLDKRSENYMNEPALLTTFYREGIEYRKEFVSLTEAVFRIYKLPIESSLTDKVKLLKMRKISKANENDSLSIKFKAGVHSSIALDIVKNLPDFLILNDENVYNYTKIDMAMMDSRLAHVIFFEQKPELKDPYYKGELYIDTETSALLGARFEINSEHIKKANHFVVRQSKNIVISPKEAIYTVSYKELNGKFYLNYIRGDMSFDVNKKKWIISSSSTVHTYFEMVSCKIETNDIKPFPSKENLPTSKIFSETKFTYDPDFWDDFNTILPEQKISDNSIQISAKIEQKIE